MKVIRKNDVQPTRVEADKQGNPAKDTFIQVLIPDGANFILRVFTVKPGGSTPTHTHPWEHETYILEGKARLTTSQGELAAEAGDAVYVEPGEVHSFTNDGAEDLRFICVVPKDTA